MSDIAPEATEAEAPATDAAEPSWEDQIAQALEAAWAAPAAGEEPEADVAPDPEPEPEPAPEPAADTPEDAPGTTPPGLSAVAAELGVDEAEAEAFLRWGSSLSSDDIAAIQSALTREEPQTAASGHGSPAPPPQGAGEELPDLPDLSLLAEAVPGLAEYLKAQHDLTLAARADLDGLRRQQASLAEVEANRRRQQTDAAIEAGTAAFREQFDLPDDRFDSIVQRAVDLQILKGLADRNGGDVTKAWTDALETAMWSDPTLRDELVQYRLDALTSEQADRQERKARAAALSGGSGSVQGSRSSAAPVNLTPEQRRKQMIDSIAAEIAGRAS